VANKISLKTAGLLDVLQQQLKTKDNEIMAYASTVMANWAFELPNTADMKFTPEQKDMLKNSMMHMADLYITSGLHDAAFLALRELHRLDPKEAMWPNLLGKVLSTLKRFDEANTYLRLCLDLNPLIVEAAHALAQNLARHGGPEGQREAITMLSKTLGVVQTYPQLPELYILLTDTLHTTGRYKEIVSVTDKALADARIKRGSAAAGKLHMMRGRALFRLGEYAAAEKHLGEAAKLMDADARVHYHWAHCLDQLARPADALARVAHALTLNPTLPAAIFLQGRLHLQQNQLAEAQTAFLKYTELKQDAPEGWFQLAQVQRRQNEGRPNGPFYKSLTQALQSWSRACQASGSCAQYFRYLIC
jgi:tetratricopeptide (TPR) repeat protein